MKSCRESKGGEGGCEEEGCEEGGCQRGEGGVRRREEGVADAVLFVARPAMADVGYLRRVDTQAEGGRERGGVV